MKKALAILFVLISVQFVFAWTDGTYIKNDVNQLHSLSTLPQYKEPIRVDVNGDGDVEDDVDYVLYNELYVRDGEKEAEVRLVYSVDPPSTFSASLDDFPGTIVVIKGKQYLITKASGGIITMGEPTEITLKKYPEYDLAEAKTVVGDLKFELVDPTSGSTLMGILYVIEGDTIKGTVDLDRDHSSGQFPNGIDMAYYIKDLTGALEGYKLYLTDARPRKTKFAVIKEDALFDIRNRETNVFGYEEVKINDDEFGQGSNKGTGKIKLLSRSYTIAEDGEARVDESENYRLQFSDANKIRLARYGFPITNETIKEQLANASAKIVTEWRGTNIKTYTGKILVLDDYGPEYIWVDGNEDGDLRDEEDYVLYNQLYVLDGATKAEVRLIYNLEPPKINEFAKGPFGNLVGMTLDITGKKYLVTSAEENMIVIGENPIEKTLRKVESADTSAIKNFVGDIGMLRVGDPQKSSLGELYIYKGESLLGSFELSSTKRDLTFSISQVTDVLDDYKVILANNSVKYASVAMVKSDKLTTMPDESANVFGYEKVYVNNDEFSEARDRVKFISKLYTIEKGNETPLDDNPDVYTLQYNKYSEFRIKKGRFLAKEEPANETANETLPTETSTPGETKAPVETAPPIIAGTGGSLLELVKAEQAGYNEYMETAGIPGIMRSFASGRYIVHVDDDTVGIVLDGGMITQIRDGGIENPTNEIWTSQDYFDKIYASDGALGLIIAGLANGEIEKKDYGFGGKLKGRAGLAGLRLSEIFSPTKITLSEEEASGEIKGLTKSVVEGTYAMNPATSDLRRTHIEMKSKEGEDLGDEEIEVKEYAGYKEGKAPAGLNKWESIEGETSLGTFVRIAAPPSMSSLGTKMRVRGSDIIITTHFLSSKVRAGPYEETKVGGTTNLISQEIGTPVLLQAVDDSVVIKSDSGEEVEEKDASLMESATIFIKYSDEDLKERGLEEDNLYIKMYDEDPDSETYEQWITLTEKSEGIKKIAKDKDNKGVWVTTSHFSVYGIGGSVYGVQGSVYGVSGHVIGPPPEPLPDVTVETTIPIEPIKEIEQPGFFKRIFLFVKAVILGR